MNLPSFPLTVKKGNSIVKIYRHVNGGYAEFKVSYYVDGRRKIETFAKFEDAHICAGKINQSVNDGNAEALILTGEQRLSFTRAMEVLKPSAVPLELAAMQFAEAVSILGGVSVIEAARFYAKHHANVIPDILVEKAVVEFIAAKTAAKRADRYIGDLQYRLGAFSEAFNCNLGDVAEDSLRGFLEGLKLSPRSQNNFRATIVTFLRWSKRKKYLPKDWDEFSAIETMEDGDGAIEIFTPEELAAILTHADDEVIVVLTIGAFAGLRSSEICRLEWKKVGVGDGKFIEVTAETARKTKQRRLVPIPSNLAAWLQPHIKTRGKVWPHGQAYLYERLEAITTNAKVEWKQNVLRHSFISYRMAEVQDAAKVSLEAGNSPQMIFSNYRELVTPAEATRWFSIKPGESGKVLFLKAA